MSTGLQSVTNYLVPATGSTNAFQLRQTFSATPTFIEFNSVALDGIAFRPSGVIIDNSAGTGDLTVLINEISFSIICAAGAMIQMPYPAPLNHTANITGLGDATVLFVDYPLIPYSPSAGGGSSGGLTNAQLRAAPVPMILDESVALTCAYQISTTSGTIAAGAHMISFKTTGATPATINTVNLAQGEVVTFEAPAGHTLGAVNYDATGTTLMIATVG